MSAFFTVKERRRDTYFVYRDGKQVGLARFRFNWFTLVDMEGDKVFECDHEANRLSDEDRQHLLTKSLRKLKQRFDDDDLYTLEEP